MQGRKINLQANLWCVFLVALLTIFLFEFTALDIYVAKLTFSQTEKIFIYREDIFLSRYLHHGLKSVMYASGLTAIGWAIYSYKKEPDCCLRESYLVAILGVVFIPLIISIAKHLTNRHCPWSMDIFGGSIPYTSLFNPPGDDYPGGQCFPAGHASGGFMWISWGMAFWYTRPMLARISLAMAILLGGLMGMGRLLQGAHFLSHTIWTVILAWFISIGLIFMVRKWSSLKKVT